MTKKNNVIETILTKYGIYLAFVILVIVLTIATPSFLTTSNLINILRQISVKGVLAIGITFVLLTGGIDLSVGSVLALSAVIATSFATTKVSHPLILALLIGCLVGVVCGVVNGFCVANLNLSPFIVTLAMTTIARGIAMIYSDGRPVINLTDQYCKIGSGSILGIPITVIVFVILILIAIFFLEFTKYGRYLRAVGGNELAARVSGVNVRLIKFSVYALTGFACGVAGILLSSRVMTGQPAAGAGYELDAIAACVIGGTSLSGGVGNMVGTVVGMLIMGVLTNGLDLLNVSSYYQQVIKGIIILLAVLLDRKKNSKK